jgi:two-component system chemotaxis response regulator CheY
MPASPGTLVVCSIATTTASGSRKKIAERHAEQVIAKIDRINLPEANMAKKIMTVDDSPTIRQMLGMALKGAGYEVVEAENGKDALSKLESEKVSMLITDLNMPEMNGIDLIRSVRQSPGLRFLPIIMLTTETQEAKRQAGKAAGASGWIVKPFKPEQLLKVVQMVMA